MYDRRCSEIILLWIKIGWELRRATKAHLKVRIPHLGTMQPSHFHHPKIVLTNTTINFLNSLFLIHPRHPHYHLGTMEIILNRRIKKPHNSIFDNGSPLSPPAPTHHRTLETFLTGNPFDLWWSTTSSPIDLFGVSCSTHLYPWRWQIP